MGYVHKIEYLDNKPFVRRSAKKKYWDNSNKEWCEYVLWTIPYNDKVVKWLKEDYGPANPHNLHLGWAQTFDKITMNESIYLFFCLKFGHENST